MADSGIIGDIGQQLGSIGKQVGQSVVQAPKTAVKTVAAQVGLEIKDGEKKKEPGAQAVPQVAQKPEELMEEAKKENANFVKELYGATPNPKPQEVKNPQQQEAINMAEKNPGKTPEEIQQMMALRQQLHGEYYQKLTHPVKRQEEAQEEQERAAERTERLKMEDLQEEQKKKEKAKPLPQEAKKTEAPMGAG